MKSYYLNIKEIKKKKFRKIGKNCKISNLVSFVEPKNISIGNNVRIDDFCIVNAYEGEIKIDDNTHICSLCFLLGSTKIEIGKFCSISHGVKIYSKTDEYKKTVKKQIYKRVLIRNNVIVGSNSVILPGVKIEDNCRIGALTVVNKNLEKNTLFYKNKKIKIS